MQRDAGLSYLLIPIGHLLIPKKPKALKPVGLSSLLIPIGHVFIVKKPTRPKAGTSAVQDARTRWDLASYQVLLLWEYLTNTTRHKSLLEPMMARNIHPARSISVMRGSGQKFLKRSLISNHVINMIKIYRWFS
jgi:hypothetical protein